MSEAFYESDCRGRTSSSLIACGSNPWQSAPSFRRRGPCSSFGHAVLSFSASFLSSEHRSIGRSMKRAGRTTRTMVLSETRHTGRPDASSGSARGPMVRHVPRRDYGRAETPQLRLPLAPSSGTWSCGEGTLPVPLTPRLLAMLLAPSVSLDRSGLPFSTAAG